MTAPSKTDLMYEITYNPKFVPKRHPKVNVKTLTVDGEKTYIMKNHETGLYLSLSEFAYDIWKLINGKRNMKEITSEVQGLWIAAAIRPDLVKEAILLYAERGALKSVLEIVKKKRVRVASAFEIDVGVVERSVELIGSVLKMVRPLLRRPLLWVSIAFIAVCAFLFSGNFVSIFADKSNFQILGSSVVGFFFYTLIALMPVHITHELAHGVALAHYGGRPGEMGTGLFYFSPMFYIDTTDAWTLTRRQRIMVYLAGNMSTLLIGSSLVVALFFLPFPEFTAHILTMVAFYCFFMALMNLAPPFETDGYYILSDLVKVPNLRMDSYGYMKTLFKRLFGRRVEEPSDLDGRKKKIFIGYTLLSAAWIAFIAFQSLTFTYYMAQDTVFFAIEFSKAILYAEPMTTGTIIVSLATFVYFAMSMAGYGLMFVTAIKNATKSVLRFEAIHDRDLSVFLYLPTGVPESVVNDLEAKMTEAAEEITPNFNVKCVGPLCRAVLRMGGTQMPLVKIREHLKKVEANFRSMYQNFLEDHRSEILDSVGIYSNRKIQLTNLLKEMAEETGVSAPEARSLVKQIIDKQAKTTLYLLNSAFGTAWTIELPPAQQREVQEELLSTFSIEDLAITDLYDEVEELKKRVIYGFDSLAKLTIKSQKALEKTLANPERHHVVSLFEPVRGRLVFVGRTEEIEEDLPAIGSLFVCQAWCGYLDNLLSETNLALSALGKASLPSKEDLRSMKPGELSVLRKNLLKFIQNEKIVHKALDESEERLECANRSLATLEERLKPTATFRVALLDIILRVNKENLRNLPKRIQKFKETFQRFSIHLRDTEKLVKKENGRRRRIFHKKRRRRLKYYPLFAVLSLILASAIIPLGMSWITIPFLAAAVFIQIAFWFLHLRMIKSFNSAGRYPSSTFNQIQIFVLALTQTIYKFIATVDVLTPTETMIKSK